MNLMTMVLQIAEGGGKDGGLGGGLGGVVTSILFIVILFGVMYFFMIRPQQKKQKEMVKFRDALEAGQKVITAGGIYGTIKEVKDGFVIVEIDNGVSIRVDRTMIMRGNAEK